MKKTTLYVLIAILVIVIVVLTICLALNKQNNNDANIEQNVNTISNQANGNDNNDDNQDENLEYFAGKSSKEWEQIIKKFYEENYGYIPSVACFYGLDGEFYGSIFVDNKDITDELHFFNDDSGYVSNQEGEVLDLINGIVNENQSIEFNDNECLAIGYVNDINENEFIATYFGSMENFESLTTYDYRTNSENNKGNKFVIVPKSDDVKITIYDCFVNDIGELELDNTLIKDITGSFVLFDDYIEYIPKLAIVFEYNGFSDTVYINFNGENGHLDLSGHEEEVKDITIYSDETSWGNYYE